MCQEDRGPNAQVIFEPRSLGAKVTGVKGKRGLGAKRSCRVKVIGS
jgi:hypothetical protein